jgi:ferrous iron transport protein B
MTSPASKSGGPLAALTGNPNSGKTTVFNALTGLRAKVGNYAGVTVERKEGRLLGSNSVRILDLPGTYSLSPQSLDEEISRDVLLNRLPELPPPDLLVVVVDASNLQRNLYYATQVVELGFPTIIALNLMDVAASNGHEIDVGRLSESLGASIVPMVANTGQGIAELKKSIVNALDKATGDRESARFFCRLPELLDAEIRSLAEMLCANQPGRRRQSRAEALLILTNEKALSSSLTHYPEEICKAVEASRARLESAGVDWRSVAIEARYTAVNAICDDVLTETMTNHETFSDKLDRVLTHKIWGTLVFVAVMALMFQSIFTFAQIPMDAMKDAVSWLGGVVGRALPPGDLNSLLVGGVIAGVGAVVVFLPQILLLFFYIGLLEDTGYMARAAFLMDRIMSKVGLHGKSFIPMLSSFACAIPGIMATRTIENPKDRLVTILVAPLMSCSARLPVYALLIGACIPDVRVLGFFKLAGLTMLAMYLLGIIVALLMAWLFKKTLLKGEPPLLIMELPPYKKPVLKVVLRHMWERSKLFLARAGTVILAINILLWGLANYPRNRANEQKFEDSRRAAIAQFIPEAETEFQPTNTSAHAESQLDAQLREIEKQRSGERLRNSFAGLIGRGIEPVIAPLGFDWKMGIGIVASFAAREVFVSTMATVYNVGDNVDSPEDSKALEDTLKRQKDARGRAVYTPLRGITLMVFYVFALQCVSTVAIVRRETNSWKWPLFQWVYMGALAWGLAFLTWQGGRLLGFQ